MNGASLITTRWCTLTGSFSASNSSSVESQNTATPWAPDVSSSRRRKSRTRSSPDRRPTRTSCSRAPASRTSLSASSSADVIADARAGWVPNWLGSKST